jgi:omega-6 fatty acid desaturase (delta-12 desaturase)
MTNQPQTEKNFHKNWMMVVKKYNQPDTAKSIWQIVNSVVPYLILWYLMYLSLEISYFLTLGLSVLAAGFLVRIFIIFHDCGHGSFFKSRKANTIAGTLLGSLAFTPNAYWHKNHAIHHMNVGNLDERGVGDVMTLTVKEYEKLSRAGKLKYKLYRNPVILFIIAPILMFVVWFRIIRKPMDPASRKSIHITNMIVVLTAAGLILLMGWKAYLMIQIPVIFLASSAGVWLFYVQHQFDDVIWTRSNDWDYKTQALEGSSYLKLPRILQWFSGNIGFHHVHHLSPRIPNYKLEKCHRENAMFQGIKPINLLPSLKTMHLKLWDEEGEKLISFREYRNLKGV